MRHANHCHVIHRSEQETLLAREEETLARQQAWADLIRAKVGPTHWCTFSIHEAPWGLFEGKRQRADRPWPVALRHSAFKDWLRQVAREGDIHVRYAWCASPFEQSALHALICAPGMTRERLEELWTLGTPRIFYYDPARGAAEYVARHSGEGPEINVACNQGHRCRRGCREARSSW